MSEPLAATTGQLHRLVYAGFVPKARIAAAFAAVDPRHDVEVWHAFARATLLPLGVSLVVIALGLARGGDGGGEAAALAFAAGAVAATLVGLVNAGKRVLLPFGIAFVGIAAVIAAHEFRWVRVLRRDDDMMVFLALAVGGTLA